MRIEFIIFMFLGAVSFYSCKVDEKETVPNRLTLTHNYIDESTSKLLNCKIQKTVVYDDREEFKENTVNDSLFFDREFNLLHTMPFEKLKLVDSSGNTLKFEFGGMSIEERFDHEHTYLESAEINMINEVDLYTSKTTIEFFFIENKMTGYRFYIQSKTGINKQLSSEPATIIESRIVCD